MYDAVSFQSGGAQRFPETCLCLGIQCEACHAWRNERMQAEQKGRLPAAQPVEVRMFDLRRILSSCCQMLMQYYEIL